MGWSHHAAEVFSAHSTDIHLYHHKRNRKMLISYCSTASCTHVNACVARALFLSPTNTANQAHFPHADKHTHTLSQKRMQNKLSTAYITLAICNLSCSPRKIIEATSQYANRMIISLTIANTWTEKKKKSSYIVSNF